MAFKIGDIVSVQYTFKPHKIGVIKKIRPIGMTYKICLIVFSSKNNDWDWVGIKYIKEIE